MSRILKYLEVCIWSLATAWTYWVALGAIVGGIVFGVLPLVGLIKIVILLIELIRRIFGW